MLRRELSLLIVFAVPGLAGGHERLSAKKCKAIDSRMKRLESRLRQAHSAKQGRTLKRQVRELQMKRFRGCR